MQDSVETVLSSQNSGSDLSSDQSVDDFSQSSMDSAEQVLENAASGSDVRPPVNSTRGKKRPVDTSPSDLDHENANINTTGSKKVKSVPSSQTPPTSFQRRMLSEYGKGLTVILSALGESDDIVLAPDARKLAAQIFVKFSSRLSTMAALNSYEQSGETNIMDLTCIGCATRMLLNGNLVQNATLQAMGGVTFYWHGMLNFNPRKVACNFFDVPQQVKFDLRKDTVMDSVKNFVTNHHSEVKFSQLALNQACSIVMQVAKMFAIAASKLTIAKNKSELNLDTIQEALDTVLPSNMKIPARTEGNRAIRKYCGTAPRDMGDSTTLVHNNIQHSDQSSRNKTLASLAPKLQLGNVTIACNNPQIVNISLAEEISELVKRFSGNCKLNCEAAQWISSKIVNLTSTIARKISVIGNEKTTGTITYDKVEEAVKELFPEGLAEFAIRDGKESISRLLF